MPAQTTAKIVIASAKRLIELRQPCLNSSRIAEISVPAWPMPIHQTKLMMANPHATGMVMPQMPTPTRNSQHTAVSSSVATAPPTPNKANQPSGVCGVSTMREIFSVTDLKVCPGAITRYSPVAGSIFTSFGFRSLVAIVASTLGRCVFHRRLFEFRVRIQNRGHIRCPRTSIQIGEHLVAALISAQFCNPAALVIDVAKRDCGCWASLLAGSHNLAIAHAAVFLIGLDLRCHDALHAVAALLHHAPRTYRHIRIARQLKALGLIVGIKQEVEAPYLIRTVVGAVPSANAAVVDHGVEPLGRMHRGAHWANLLAGSVLAMLAIHRLKVRARRCQVAFKVRIDAQPLHVASDAHLLLADYGNVVLCVTAHDARVASRAAVHVDRHAPCVVGIRPVGE